MTQRKTIIIHEGRRYRLELLDETTEPKVVYLCPQCRCPDVEGTAWIHLNTAALREGVPLEEYWCPACEETVAHLLAVDVSTGEAQGVSGNYSAAVDAYLKREGWR